MNIYNFSGKMWASAGQGAWYFVTVPGDISEEIRHLYGELSPGFGSVPVEVVIGNSTWKTSVFFDRKFDAYLLPIKGIIRKKEQLLLDELIAVEIHVAY